MKSLNIILFLFAATLVSAQTTADFENITLLPESYDNNASDSNFFSSGHIELPNDYNAAFDSWTGWAISSMTDITTPGYQNQYSAISGTGVNNSNNYAVAYVFGENQMFLTGEAKGGVVQGLYINNGTYAYLSMLEGDGFAKKFGGETGSDPDFFKITIRKSLNNQVGSDSVEFYLADYRFANNALDYIVNDWTYVDLTSLGNVDHLIFTLSSSDIGDFGINTPTYFCVDDVTTSDLPSASIEFTTPKSYKVWPNPVANELQINLEQSKVSTAWISSIHGEKLLEKSLSPGLNKVDVGGLAPGVFTLQVIQDGHLSSEIFIKN